ncbi:MAG: class I SAM-dependent methyltransferase [Acidobacteria bacterium]|nr:class I SAM-dependent methyltransferase [Acidobacteriota bacterium]
MDELRAAITNGISAEDEQELGALLAGGDEWAVHLDTARVLAALMRKVQPASVLEFGAGRSSLVLARVLTQYGGGRLTSIEHQVKYAAPSWERIRGLATVDAVLKEAPVRLSASKHGLLYQYAGIASTLAARGPFDFVFIDAPPGQLGRDATLFQCASMLHGGAVIVLDDATRPAEQTAIRRWQRALPLDLVSLIDNTRGTAVLRLRERTRARMSLRTVLGTVHDRLTN